MSCVKETLSTPVMAGRIFEVICNYQRQVQQQPYTPVSSYVSTRLGPEGVVTKLFLAYLFCDKDMAVQFLKDVGLIRDKMLCSTCGCYMSWCKEAGRKDGFRWRCRRRTSTSICSVSTTIRHGSWFQCSNLTLMEVMLLTYDIIRHVPSHAIHREHQFGSSTIADWTQFCKEAMLYYIMSCSRKVGGPNKTVEIDESEMRRLKFIKGRRMKERWVFGGVERESGNTFLVPVQKRTADALMAVISAWIEPGTTVVSDCPAAHRGLEEPGTVNRTIAFVDEQNGVQTNTIQATWHHMKACLKPYGRRRNYIDHLAHHMFTASCKSQNVDEFTKFLEIIANTDWNQIPSRQRADHVASTA